MITITKDYLAKRESAILILNLDNEFEHIIDDSPFDLESKDLILYCYHNCSDEMQREMCINSICVDGDTKTYMLQSNDLKSFVIETEEE